MSMFKKSPLGDLARLRDVRTRRISSWDKTGGNNDFLVVKPKETVVLADIEGAGTINHIWCTHMCQQPDYLRRVVLRMKWDNEDHWSVEVPLGDFFGVGHAKTVNFVSLPLQMSPSDGKAFNCWFPMPFSERAYMELTNEGDQDMNFYYYVDYELHDSIPEDYGRFHAQWNRVNPTQGISDEGMPNVEYEFGGTNIGGKDNYVILEAEGRGHYVGCNLNTHNLRIKPELEWPKEIPWPLDMDNALAYVTPEQREKFMEIFNWYGEGDDMIFIDGEEWPPSLHGTGTEDYFNTAYCPMVQYSAPYHGLTLPGGPNWSGKVSYYRFHIEDPIHFQKSIKVTIEHGHANRRSDDISSTAYWYQAEPHKPFKPLPPVEERLPRED
ncbi:MAG: DUF2961 domain-containing protein [Chloroflexi bacterium]|nr:DUF2961 domain-containing protein [Chloroflexota bacterium]